MTEIDPRDCPYYLTSRATLALTSALKRAFGSAGVNNVRPAYLGVLMCLWRQDGLKAVELGRQALLEPSSMTGLVDRMERDGLLTRKADPEDRRVQRIYLTDEGRRVRRPTTRLVLDALGHLLDDVSDEDLSRFKEILRTLIRNARKVSEP